MTQSFIELIGMPFAIIYGVLLIGIGIAYLGLINTMFRRPNHIRTRKGRRK